MSLMVVGHPKTCIHGLSVIISIGVNYTDIWHILEFYGHLQFYQWILSLFLEKGKKFSFCGVSRVKFALYKCMKSKLHIDTMNISGSICVMPC